MRRLCRAVVVVVVCVVGLAGCGDDDGGGAAGGTTTTTAADSTGSTATVRDPALQAELLAMFEEDQAERSGEASGSGDAARAERLGEIFDEHGWPGVALVDRDGSTAAWTIAQHADHDLAFQERALDLLRGAVEEEDASAGDLAYLQDRVAVNKGEPQLYGTQIRCREDGLGPATPLVGTEEEVDARREEAGLGTLEEYYEVELQGICSPPS